MPRALISSYFNPRSPHGERRASCLEKFDFEEFQSTLPARGATEFGFGAPLPEEISIHAPRTGSDAKKRLMRLCDTYFNPRSPHGERQ